jgi:hypothetical protein
MMTKTLLNTGVFLTVLYLAGAAAAQSPVALATRQAELRALAAALYQRDLQDQQAVQAYARRLGIAVRRELPDGRVLELQRLLPGPLLGQKPIFYITNNIVAADTVSTDEVWPGGSAGLDLDGSGMSMAEWDGGAVFADHPDFAGRLTQVDGASLVSGHSTHVAGTLIGGGDWLYADSRGMAFAAHLDAYDWNSDTAEMAAAAAAGELVSNHSYGIAAGWLYLGGSPPDQWWWIGGADPADVEDPNFGYYDAESRLWDQIAFDAPYYLPVKAAGNDRTDIGPAPGEEYTVIDQQGNFLFTSTAPRNPDCAPAGYDCLPTHSVAKNILTVGAVDDLPGGYSPLGGPGAVAMADFSSWGPTDDGRIKPDLVGNGMFLFSAWPDSPYYALAAGTSMAAPNVTGSLLLLQQHYENVNGPGSFMRGATLKALAIHTADETGDAPGPDYEFGWGLLNTRTAARVISEDGGAQQIIEGSLANGGVQSYAVSVALAGAVVTATLVWADPPGTPVAPALDPPDLMLVNDLDLRITRGPATWFPWVLNPAAPAAAASKGDNFRDNVEQVEITGAASGGYTVEVGHKGTLLNGSNQDYSVIISVTPPPPVGSGFLIDEDFSGGMPAGWSVVTSQGVSWSIKTPVPGDWRLGNNTGGGGQFAMVDNNYTRVLTSLRTPALDLSVNDAAILRFSSYFLFDFFETINVDVSTDGGSSWSNVWQNWGFNQFAARVVLDLSAAIAGQSNVMLRFRYDSLGDPQGNLWQVDDIELEVFGGGVPPGDPPGPASNPNPADGAAGLGIDSNLAWTAGALATAHDVYFGTGAPLGGGDFQATQPATTFDPGTLTYATTYFWRIDEVNADGTTEGATWSFTTETAPVVATMHLAGISGSALPGSRGRWTASVQVTVADQADNAEPGVAVAGVWSNGASGGSSCTTGSTGTCTVEKSNLKSNTASVAFTVTGLDKAGMTYDPADNAGSVSITVSQGAADQAPVAANDSYQTGVGVPLDGNVMDNDDPGDGPASIASNTLPANGSLSLAVNGVFTYTPDPGFEGDDDFTYRIVDQDGDLSNTASVAITVASAPPPGTRTVGATPFKVKGVQHVELAWQNFTGTGVNISRDGVPLFESPTDNDGLHVDNIGVKGSGQTYLYEVCEAGTSNCAGATANF